MRRSSLFVLPAAAAAAVLWLAGAAAHEPGISLLAANEESDAAPGPSDGRSDVALDRLPASDSGLAAELGRARSALEDAQARVEQADADYSRMRRSNRPRGAAKAEIIQERADARAARDEAKAHYDELERRSGSR